MRGLICLFPDEAKIKQTTDNALEYLSQFDMIWAGSLVRQMFMERATPKPNVGWNSDAFDAYRLIYPDRLMLHYVPLCSAKPLWKYTFNYEWIDKNKPEWFVRRDATQPIGPGNRIPWSQLEPTKHYLDVTNPEFGSHAARVIVEMCRGYSGLAGDNGAFGTERAKSITNVYPHWEFAGREDEWNIGFLDYLRLLKSMLTADGMKLIVNHSLDYDSDVDDKYWSRLRRRVDGVMSEKPIGANKVQSKRYHKSITDRGLYDCWAVYDHHPLGNITDWHDTKVNGLSMIAMPDVYREGRA